jgi:hypothetical protein
MDFSARKQIKIEHPPSPLLMTPEKIKESLKEPLSANADLERPSLGQGHLFYAQKQRLHLLLKSYLKQVNKSNSRDTDNIKNYSKVIESIINKLRDMDGTTPDFIKLSLVLFAVTILCEHI